MNIPPSVKRELAIRKINSCHMISLNRIDNVLSFLIDGGLSEYSILKNIDYIWSFILEAPLDPRPVSMSRFNHEPI